MSKCYQGQKIFTWDFIEMVRLRTEWYPIICSIVVMATCSVRYSKSKIRGQKHPREVVKSRNSTLTSAREGQVTTGHPFPNQQTHNYMLRPISRIQTHSYIYILVQTIMSVQAKLEVVRRKHIVHLTGFGAYSSTCYKGTDNCAGTMGVDQLPSSTVRL